MVEQEAKLSAEQERKDKLRELLDREYDRVYRMIRRERLFLDELTDKRYAVSMRQLENYLFARKAILRHTLEEAEFI